MNVSTMVATARTVVRGLDARSFAAAARRNDVVVIDVREADERVSDGVIPGSIHVPRGMLEFRADPSSPLSDPRLRPDRPVLVYCAAGSRSALAAATLQSMKYEDVAHLDGGVAAWMEAGMPLVGRMSMPY